MPVINSPSTPAPGQCHGPGIDQVGQVERSGTPRARTTREVDHQEDELAEQEQPLLVDVRRRVVGQVVRHLVRVGAGRVGDLVGLQPCLPRGQSHSGGRRGGSRRRNDKDRTGRERSASREAGSPQFEYARCRFDSRLVRRPGAGPPRPDRDDAQHRLVRADAEAGLRPGHRAAPRARRRADRLLRPPAAAASCGTPANGSPRSSAPGRTGSSSPPTCRRRSTSSPAGCGSIARRNLAHRPRIRGHALVLGAGGRAAGAGIENVSAADDAGRPRRDRRSGRPGDDAADAAVLLQPRPVADRAGPAGEGACARRREAAASSRSWTGPTPRR